MQRHNLPAAAAEPDLTARNAEIRAPRREAAFAARNREGART